ncbi:MAG: glycosyltransferase family 1 protein, partial [Elusimicrobiota bacterium]
IWEYFYLSDVLRMTGIDVYHATALSGPLKADIKRVSSCFDFIPLRYKDDVYSSFFKELRKKVQYRFFLKALKTSRHVISISDYTKSEVVKYLNINPERITTVYLGFSSDFKCEPNPKIFEILKVRYNIRFPYLLYVGCTDERKNVPALINACITLIREQGQQIQLVVVGNKCKNIQLMEENVRKEGMDDRFIFTGIIPQVELIALYNHARLFCFPSLEEGFGLPVIEAMACGLPVVAYNCKAVAEVAGDSCIIVNNMQEDFFNAVNKILYDEVLWNLYREKGLKRAQRYSWKKTATETLHIYHKISTHK